jgi:hypothetical protein
MTFKEKFFASVAIISIIFALISWFFPRTNVPVLPKPDKPHETTQILTEPTGTILCPSGGIVVYSYPTPFIKIEWKTKTIYSVNTVYNDTASTIKDEEAIIATGIVPPWQGNTNVYTYFNMFDGKSRMIYAQQPIGSLPERDFLGRLDEKSIGAWWGYGTKGKISLIEGNWELFRTGSFNWGIKPMGYLYDSKIDIMLLVGGKYTWH